MRPAGEIRSALRDAFRSLSEQRGPATWRDVLPVLEPQGVDARSRAEAALVRYTVENMVRAGELVCVGSHKPAGQRVWLSLYEPAAPGSEADEGVANAAAALQRAVREWVMLG